MLLALRLAWRSILHSRTRTILLVLALALPVGAVTTWFAIRATGAETPAIMAARQLGRADVVIGRAAEGTASPLPQQLIAARQSLSVVTPAVAAAGTQVKGFTTVRSATGTELDTQVFARDPLPVFEGRHLLEAGYWPSSPNDIAISPSISTAFDAGIGSSLVIEGRSFDVVGIGVETSSLDARFIVMPLQTGLSVMRDASGSTDSTPVFEWFLTSSPPTEELTRLEGGGWSVTTRDAVIRLYESAGVFDPTNIYLASIAVVALAELSLIMAGVYAVQFQGRVREQALLAAIGAPPRHRRRVAVIDGLMVAAAAAALGVTGGLLLASVLFPGVAAATNQRWEVFQIPYVWIGLLIALVLCAGGVAAHLASSFVTQDLTILLKGGLRPLRGGTVTRRVPVKRILVAVALGGLGAVATLPALVAGGVIILGWSLLVIMRERLSRSPAEADRDIFHLLAWRAASSQLHRSLAFAAIPMSMVALIGLLSAVLGGASHAADTEYQPQGPTGSVLVQTTKPVSREAVHQAGEILSSPGVALLSALAPEPVPLDDNGVPFTYWGHFAPAGSDATPVYLAEERDVVSVLGRDLTAAERAAFLEGSVLSRVPDFVKSGSVELVAPDPSSARSGQLIRRSAPAVVVDGLAGPQRALPVLLMSVTAGEAIGVRQPNFSVAYLAPTDRVPDEKSEARVRGVLAADVGSNFVDVQVERGSTTASYMRSIVLSSLAGLIVATLAITVLLATLALHEQRRTFALLSAMGGTAQQRGALVGRQLLVPLGLGAAAGAALVLFGAPLLTFSLDLPLTSWPAAAVLAAVLLVTTIPWACSGLYRFVGVDSHHPRA